MNNEKWVVHEAITENSGVCSIFITQGKEIVHRVYGGDKDGVTISAYKLVVENLIYENERMREALNTITKEINEPADKNHPYTILAKIATILQSLTSTNG